MLYTIFGSLIRLGTRQFFRELLVTGARPEIKGPLIVAANHPNQAVDPFLIGTVFPRPLYFLAKSTLFKNPLLGWFFRSLHMIPVYRKQDNSDTAKNDEMFSAAADALIKHYAIAIFPEGTSREERQLLPLKTGAARLAFYAISKSDAALDLSIQPVGITYLTPRIFQSSVTITIGDPIVVNKYMPLHAENPQQAVHALTDEIELALKKLTVTVHDLHHQELIENITFLFGEDGNIKERMQQIADYVEKLAPLYPGKKEDLESKLFFYRQMRQLFPARTSQQQVIPSFLTYPLALAGAFLNLLPYKLTNLVAVKFVKDPHNLASIKIGCGLLLYVIWYAFIALLIAVFFGTSFGTSIILFILLCIFAMFTNSSLEHAWGSLIAALWIGPSPIRFLESFQSSLREELLMIIGTGDAATLSAETKQDTVQ